MRTERVRPGEVVLRGPGALVPLPGRDEVLDRVASCPTELVAAAQPFGHALCLAGEADGFVEPAASADEGGEVGVSANGRPEQVLAQGELQSLLDLPASSGVASPETAGADRDQGVGLQLGAAERFRQLERLT